MALKSKVTKPPAEPPAEPPPKRVKAKSRNKPAPAPAPPVEKTAKGFARAEILMPTNQMAVLNNLVAREEQNPSGPVEPVSSTVVLLLRLANSMSKGEDIAEIKPEITRIVAHQPEKADVFQSLLNLINQERAADAAFMRAAVEKVLKRSVQRGDITTSECLAIWEITNNIVTSHEAKAAKQNKALDTVTVVEKVDLHTLESERLIEEKWAGTTPQGRQIIRMKLFELKKRVRTETTTTASETDEEEKPVIDVK